MILECGLKPSNVKFVKEEILKLIDVVMDVFIKTTEKEPISYCFWSMHFYTQKYEGSCDHLLSLFMSHSPYAAKKFVSFFSLEQSFGAVILPLKNIIITMLK